MTLTDPQTAPSQEGEAGAKSTAMDVEDKRNEDEKLESWKVPDDDPRWEKVTEDGGLLKWVLKAADEDAETPVSGAKIKAHYTGMLKQDGSKFDSSKDRGKEFDFSVGQGQVIKGWDQGFLAMKVGERAVLRCRSDYAYGETGSPPNIPGGATLDFVVELISIQEFDAIYDCDGIFHKTLKEGSYKTVKEMGKCTVTWKARSGTKKGTVFAEGTNDEIYVPYDDEFEDKGTLADYKYCRAFYKCLSSKATVGGEHMFKVESNEQWTYGPEKCKELGIEPTADLFFEIAVSEVDNPKQSWELKKEEKVEAATTLKDKANNFFKQGKLALAKKLYKDAAQLTDNESSFEEEEKKAADALSAIIHSNMGLVHIKLDEIGDALEALNKGLEKDSKSVKLLFRRATCHDKNGDWDEAIADLEKALEVDSKNSACLRLKKSCRAKRKGYRKKQAALAKAFFS